MRTEYLKRWLAVIAAAAGCLLLAGTALADSPPPGPPYPGPVENQAVYDYAGIFSTETIVSAEMTIDAIEERTGAEVAVYTQVKPESDTPELARADASALMDQWGVGRKGFDDGLVILFDLDRSLCHGQVVLLAGAGYEAAFLSQEERQAIFDEEMMPWLRVCDMDEALLVALEKVDANATAEHAASLEFTRQVNALLNLAGGLVGWILLLLAVLYWFVHGRDPFFLDDPSIYMPAPPAGLTPAMATLILSQRASRRTVAAALMDLAARGSIAFRQETVRGEPRAGIKVVSKGDPPEYPERRLLEGIRRAANTKDYVGPSRMHKLWSAVQDLKEDVEKEAVQKGWLAQAPSAVKLRWGGIAGSELVFAAFAGFFWLIFPASFLFTLTAGLAIAGLATLVLAFFMPARTRTGARHRVMLEAYRRTLAATLKQSSSLGEAVERRPLPWITTPDEAMAWGVALGLNDELEGVLARMQVKPEAAAGAALSSAVAGSGAAWSPSWWTAAPAGSGGGSGGRGGGGPSSKLFSSTPFPDPGAIFAALGSLASPPSPPSSGGSSWSSSGSSSRSSGGSSWSSSSGGGFSGGSSSGGSSAGGGF